MGGDAQKMNVKIEKKISDFKVNRMLFSLNSTGLMEHEQRNVSLTALFKSKNKKHYLVISIPNLTGTYMYGSAVGQSTLMFDRNSAKIALKSLNPSTFASNAYKKLKTKQHIYEQFK